MNFTEIKPPRRFKVGDVEIQHCANVLMQSDEQVTFITESGKEYDVMRKSWGFFATPSINSRLKKFGLKAALIQDSTGKLFVCLVEYGKEEEFKSYLEHDHACIKCWIDDNSARIFNSGKRI